MINSPFPSLKIKNFLHPKPQPKGMDVLCQLQHFAIITYAVDSARFDGLFPNRFVLDTLVIDGVEKVLISVVPFIDGVRIGYDALTESSSSINSLC
jgi:hypothetical protein